MSAYVWLWFNIKILDVYHIQYLKLVSFVETTSHYMLNIAEIG